MKRKIGLICIILSALFFALGGLLIKLNTWSALTINGVRSFFAFFVMLTYMRVTKHRFKVNATVIGGAIANFGMGLTFVMANKLTTAANTIVLQFTMPIYIILFLWLFWKKKPDRLSVLTVCISFAGICCFFLESISFTGMIGNCLAIFSGVLYAVVFLIKKMPGADFESSALISFCISLAVGLPSFVTGGEFTVMNWTTVILLGVVQFGMAYVCLNIGLNEVPPVAASLISMIEPIINPILVAVVYKETIGPLGIVGSVIVLGSAIVYNVLSLTKQEQAAES